MGGRLIEFGAGDFKAKSLSKQPALPEHYPKLTRTVYNFEVQDNHTYYVGRLGIWVHNKGVLTEAEAVLVNGSQASRKFFKMGEQV